MTSRWPTFLPSMNAAIICSSNKFFQIFLSWDGGREVSVSFPLYTGVRSWWLQIANSPILTIPADFSWKRSVVVVIAIPWKHLYLQHLTRRRHHWYTWDIIVVAYSGLRVPAFGVPNRRCAFRVTANNSLMLKTTGSAVKPLPFFLLYQPYLSHFFQSLFGSK